MRPKAGTEPKRSCGTYDLGCGSEEVADIHRCCSHHSGAGHWGKYGIVCAGPLNSFACIAGTR
jgi:hypothetical protein